MMMDEGLELLDEAECMALLGSATIGRIALNIGALPAIFPVNFAMDGSDIIFRTGQGTKLAAASDHAVVAFECDRIDPLEHTGWSVMAVGKAQVVSDPSERSRLEHLPLTPWAGGDRSNTVRIPVEFISGRRSGR